MSESPVQIDPLIGENNIREGDVYSLRDGSSNVYAVIIGLQFMWKEGRWMFLVQGLQVDPGPGMSAWIQYRFTVHFDTFISKWKKSKVDNWFGYRDFA